MKSSTRKNGPWIAFLVGALAVVVVLAVWSWSGRGGPGSWGGLAVGLGLVLWILAGMVLVVLML